MKFPIYILLIFLPFIISKSMEESYGWRPVQLSVISHGKPTSFSIEMGLHPSGLLFRPNSAHLQADTTNFFTEACFLKEGRHKQAYLDYRLVDCGFHLEEGGLFDGQYLLLNTQNHEEAKENSWTVAIEPKSRGLRVCGNLLIKGFAAKLAKKCESRHNSIKFCLKEFTDKGEKYYRALKEVESLEEDSTHLKNEAHNVKDKTNNLIEKKKLTEKIWKKLKKNVGQLAKNYLKVKERTKYELANNLNKPLAVSQIDREIFNAKNRYQVAIRNMEYVRKKIVELIPDAEDLTERAFKAADEGKHRDILKGLKITP